MKKFLLSISALLTFGSAFSQTYEWVQQIGSNSNSSEFSFLSLSDKNGHVYVLSEYNDTIDADPGSGVLEIFPSGASNRCIQKLNLDGSLSWAKQLSSTAGININSFDIDQNGELYLTGTFSGTMDFDMGTGVNSVVSNDPKSAFVTKFDANGDLIWVKTMRAKGNVYYGSLEFDQSNNIYHSFIFSDSLDINPNTANDLYEYSASNYRSVILKMDNLGNYVWHKIFDINEPGVMNIQNICLNGNDLYFVGEFGDGSVDFDPNAGISLLTPVNNSWDGCYGKFDLNGNLVWVKQAGGTGGDYMKDIKIDSYGNLVISGLYYGSIDLNIGGTLTTLDGPSSDNVFLYKCSPSGEPLWAVPIAGSGSDKPEALILDHFDNIYIGGSFESTVDLDPQTEVFNITSLGTYDGFAAKYNREGSLLYGWSIGSTYMLDWLYSLTVDEENNVYASGRFGNTMTFNTQNGSVDLTSTGGIDAYSVKLSCAPIDNTVTYNVNEFEAVETAAIAYQWYDCNTGLVMPGETAPIYTATDVLNVAVSITMDNNGCVAVSDCIDILSVDDLEISTVTIYPNPSTDKFTIEAENGIDQLAVYSMAGELILMENFLGTTAAELTPQLNPGVYLVKVTDAAGNLHITQWIKL